MTHSRRDVVDLLNSHGLRASRALGQNFVTDPNTVRRIARLARVGKGERVVEVGAGLGSLTLALAETGAEVVAIEVDKYVTPVLRTIVEPLGVSVLQADALTLDWESVGRAVLVANLPYNVGTRIVTRVLETAPNIERMVVMLQREVAQRLAAQKGEDAYGALSVKVRYHADAKLLGVVPPTVFVPKPDVESAIVELQRLPAPRVDPNKVTTEQLFHLVNTAFAQRRKMLRHTLSGVVSSAAFARANIAPTERPEQLDVVDWGRLAYACKPD